MAQPEFQSKLESNLEDLACFTYEDNMLSSTSVEPHPVSTNLIKSTDFMMEQIITFPKNDFNIHCPPPLLGIPQTCYKFSKNEPTYPIFHAARHGYFQNRQFQRVISDNKVFFPFRKPGYMYEDDNEESSYQIYGREVRMPFIKNEKKQEIHNEHLALKEIHEVDTMPSRSRENQISEQVLLSRPDQFLAASTKSSKNRSAPQKVVRCFPSSQISDNYGEGRIEEESSQLSVYSIESDEEFLLTVPQPKTHRKLRNRKYKKSNAQKSHYYAKDELTKKIMRDIREQLYKSFISTIPAAKLNNRAYQITALKTWLEDTQGIKNFEVFDQEDLVTVFCHLRVRKIRAKALKTGLTDLEQILAGSKFKTIQFLRTTTGRFLFYQRFRKLWRHKVQSQNILKREDLRTEFTKYFRSIETEVEARFVHSKPTRGKPPIWKE